MPIEEREGVEHHLMDFLPMESEYTVLDFKADALQLVCPIHMGANAKKSLCCVRTNVPISK